MQDPEEWMSGKPVLEMKVEKKGESIRSWYQRTTRKVRNVLVWSSVIGCVFAVIFYFSAPYQTHLKLQVFNGAVVIPVAAIIWIAAFVFVFLVPSREVSFRSQESIEQTVEILKTAVNQLLVSTAVWERIGRKVETELPRFIEEARKTMEELREVSGRLEQAITRNEKFADEARPALEALKRIEDRFETEIKSGFFEEMKAAAASVRNLSGPPVKKATEPDLDWALASIKTKPRNP